MLNSSKIMINMPIKQKIEGDAGQLRQRNRELAILNAIAQALNRSVDLEQTLHEALAQVAELFGLHTGWVWLMEKESGEPYLAAAQNLPPGLIKNPRLMEGTCYCLDTFLSGDLDGAANVNVITCSRLKKLVDGTDGLRYHASIPLYAHGKELGVLNVASTDWRELSSEDLRLLYTIGDMLGIAIERARLFAESAEFGATEERNRLAREIHDTLAQGLAAIILQLETVDALLERNNQPEKAKQAVHKALELSRAGIEEARRSVMDLRAAPLEGRSLIEALKAYVNSYERESRIKVELDVTGGTIPIPLQIETGLYRIIQEVMENVRRHARAQKVIIHLHTMPQAVRLEIEDDGIGFLPDQVASGKFGLIGMNERARLLGGSFKVQSSPGAGTKSQVIVPIS
jgi:two-component system NarL family sensor kinase